MNKEKEEAFEAWWDAAEKPSYGLGLCRDAWMAGTAFRGKEGPKLPSDRRFNFLENSVTHLSEHVDKLEVAVDAWGRNVIPYLQKRVELLEKVAFAPKKERGE